MTDAERFELFVSEINTNRMIWLLQAKPGLFALLEDNRENTYLPVWATEEEAKEAAKDNWEGYTADFMGFGEFLEWLKEFEEDLIDIAISPDKDGRILPMKPEQMRKILFD